MKIKCVKESNSFNWFTLDNEYLVKDGVLTDDEHDDWNVTTMTEVESEFRNLGYEFELVDELNNEFVFAKEKLQNGMVVENRLGTRYLVHNEKLIGSNVYCCLSDFNDDLTVTSTPNLDIIKAYKSFGVTDTDEFFWDSNLNVFWKREEEIEMTMEEVCKALGKKVKIVQTKS